MKSSTAIGHPARIAFNNEWKLIPITQSRVVAVRPIQKGDSSFAQCKDCERESQFFIVEMSRFTPQGKRSEHDLVWGWCGICDIGRATE